MALLNSSVASIAADAFAQPIDGPGPGCGAPVPCHALQAAPIEGATIINSTGKIVHDIAVEGFEDSVDVCAFEVYLTHDGANDAVRVLTWLPTGATTWNERYQGTGGGGFWAGFFEDAMGPGAVQGFAVSSTDGGYGADDGDPTAWVTDPQIVTNIGYLSFHEMTVIGKAATKDFYGRPAKYNYWAGNSMGGRQGHSEAQRYPEDYDGILSCAAPPGWEKVAIMIFWPYLVQSQGEHGFVGECKLGALTNASIEACKVPQNDPNGVITDPRDCDFKASSYVSRSVSCKNGTQSNITEYDAAIWEKIRDGPRRQDGSFLWWGLEPGTSYSPWANAPPENISNTADWVLNFLIKDEGFDISTIDFELYDSLWDQTIAEYNDSWGSDDPDLTAFKARGGKILAWHGWADERVPSEGSIRYWDMVSDKVGGKEEMDKFYRLFLAPGSPHPVERAVSPIDMALLVDWVEKGIEPQTLPEAGERMSVKSCLYPEVLQYNGEGDAEDPDSWSCA